MTLLQRLSADLDQLESSAADISERVSRLNSLQPSELSLEIKGVEQSINDIETRISKTKGDIKKVPSAEREEPNDRLNQIEEDVSKAKTDLNQIKQAKRTELQYESTLDGNLQQSNQVKGKLNEAIRIQDDTIKTTVNTNIELKNQGETLNRIDGNVSDIRVEAQTGKIRAKRMIRRMWMNKILAWVIVVVLLAILIGVIIYKAKRKKN